MRPLTSRARAILPIESSRSQLTDPPPPLRSRTHARRCDSSLHAPVRLRSTASTHLASGIPMRRTRKPERRGGSNGIRPCAPRAAASVPVPAAGGEQTWIPLPRATLDLPAGEWTEVPTAGVTFAKGFRAAGVYAGMRSKGTRPDLSLIVCDGPVRTLTRTLPQPNPFSRRCATWGLGAWGGRAPHSRATCCRLVDPLGSPFHPSSQRVTTDSTMS